MKTQRLDALDEQILELMRAKARKRSDLVALVERSDSIVRNHIGKLAKYGFVSRSGHGIYKITSQGEARLNEIGLPHLSPNLNDRELQELMKQFPTEGHRALFRLILDAVVAKRHLWEYFEQGWPCFFAVGRTKSFKTALGAVVCQLIYGLDASLRLYSLQTATEGELLGRRRQIRGGDMTLATSPLWREPFIMLDEFDKARDEKVTRIVRFICDGRRQFLIESELIQNHVVPFVTMNLSKTLQEQLGEPYLRRGVVLNVDAFGDEIEDIELYARSIFDKAKKLRFDFGRAILERNKLSEEDFRFLHRLAHGHLRKESRHLLDTKALEILVLGRSFVLGNSVQVREAIFQAVFDYLTCADTMGFTEEEWGSRFMALWVEYGGQEDAVLRQRLEAYYRRREERERKRKELEMQRIEKSLSLLHEQESFISRQSELNEVLRLSKEKLSSLRGWQLVTKPLRVRLDYWQEQIQRVQSLTELKPLGQEIGKILNDEVKLLVREYERQLQFARDECESLITQGRDAKKRIKRIEDAIKRWSRTRATFLPYAQKTASHPNIPGYLLKLGLIKKVHQPKQVETIGSAIRRQGFFGLGAKSDRPPEYETIYEEKYQGVDGRYYSLDYFDSWAAATALVKMKITECDRQISDLHSQKEQTERHLLFITKTRTSLSSQTVPALPKGRSLG